MRRIRIQILNEIWILWNHTHPNIDRSIWFCFRSHTHPFLRTYLWTSSIKSIDKTNCVDDIIFRIRRRSMEDQTFFEWIRTLEKLITTLDNSQNEPNEIDRFYLKIKEEKSFMSYWWIYFDKIDRAKFWERLKSIVVDHRWYSMGVFYNWSFSHDDKHLKRVELHHRLKSSKVDRLKKILAHVNIDVEWDDRCGTSIFRSDRKLFFSSLVYHEILRDDSFEKENFLDKTRASSTTRIWSVSASISRLCSRSMTIDRHWNERKYLSSAKNKVQKMHFHLLFDWFNVDWKTNLQL